MSKIDFNQLNTLGGFKAFLSAYHGQLSDTRRFPPLGLQKALHTAAPVFGYADWHVMSAALQSPLAVAQSMTEAQLDFLARINRFEFVDMDDEWGWMNLNETQQSPSGWPTKAEALAHAFEYYELEMTVPDLPAQAPAAPAEPERIHVVMVTITEFENADEGAQIVANDTYAYRRWDDAQAYLIDRIKSKMMHNDRDRSELLECTAISAPTEEDGLADMDDDEVVDWIGENNHINDLGELLSHLDYGLTTVSFSDTWI